MLAGIVLRDDFRLFYVYLHSSLFFVVLQQPASDSAVAITTTHDVSHPGKTSNMSHVIIAPIYSNAT